MVDCETVFGPLTFLKSLERNIFRIFNHFFKKMSQEQEGPHKHMVQAHRVPAERTVLQRGAGHTQSAGPGLQAFPGHGGLTCLSEPQEDMVETE